MDVATWNYSPDGFDGVGFTTPGYLGYYPFDTLRDCHLPPVLCWSGNEKHNTRYIRMLFGITGRDYRPAVVIGTAERSSLLRCVGGGLGPVHGVYLTLYLSGLLSRPGYVYRRPQCNCLRMVLQHSVYGQTWKQTTEKRYATPYMAGCAVAFYFLRKLCFAPLQVVEVARGGKFGTVVVVYHSDVTGGSKMYLELSVQTVLHGFVILDPVIKNSRIQLKRCSVCLRGVSTVKGPNCVLEPPGLMFMLSCNRHSVCEDCIYDAFSGSDGPLRLESRGALVCTQCMVALTATVGVPLRGMHVARGPVPVAWFHNRPVFTSVFRKALEEFHDRHIAWYHSAKETTWDGLASARRSLVLCEERVESAEECPLNEIWIDGAVAAVRKADRCVDLWLVVARHVDEAFRHVAFLYVVSEPYPDEFLNQNASHYENVLGRAAWMRKYQKAYHAGL